MDLKQYLHSKKLKVEKTLEELIFPETGLLSDHAASMRYSLFAGGKRIRPVLCLAAIEALDIDPTPYLPIACSLECIHTYSLIHDDLPAMDNDDLRRGKPTNHKVFGEAEAILAGDGLLTFAFDLLSNTAICNSIKSDDRIQLIQIIAKAVGSSGMVGGQALDIESEGKSIPFETLQYLHSLKTGALITASVQTGAVIGQANQIQFEALTAYGKAIGLAFQIVDDLLDVEGTEEELGKTVGADAALNKATYPSLFGVEETRKKAIDTVDNALAALEGFDEKADYLREIAKYIYYRNR